MASNTTYKQIREVIKDRRTVKTGSMNGKKINNDLINELLGLATWAPNHGRTEPWYFFVYTGEALAAFGTEHADLHQNNTPEEKRNPATYEKLQHMGDNASHLIVAVMKRGNNPKIPQFEEICAASAAIENMLIAAEAADIATFWSTGGLTNNPIMKQHLQLGEEDIVLGLIYMGYTDEPKKDGMRNAPLESKIKWM